MPVTAVNSQFVQVARGGPGSPTTESKLSACEMLVDATHGTLMSVLYVYYGPYSYIALKKASHWRGPRYLKGGSGPHPRHGGCERSSNQTRVEGRSVRLTYDSCAPEQLLRASSVNSILKTVYDVIETHRAAYNQCLPLRHDVTAQNIPDNVYARLEDRDVSESRSVPAFIANVLDELFSSREHRRASCVVVDPDWPRATMPGEGNRCMNDINPRHKGTPAYMARSVCMREPQGYALSIIGVPMPTLKGEAQGLYVKAYGQERFERFMEKNSNTCHGAVPPDTYPDPLPPFVHRPCHGVESIFWTMLAALLRVQPRSAAREPHASPPLARLWKKLQEHRTPEGPAECYDDREGLFVVGRSLWVRLYFQPEMRDVAHLLYEIRCQLGPEYEFWTPRPPDDHLHEALQRLILQYLVDHRDKDISLDPDHLRPTWPGPPTFRKRVQSIVA
ncbi:hypothetical protein K466DRAFT_655989 [Polyporus arcularius HHB13444]|uniref:Fungal-type protein kinase domain-containing protein n=1 Tax=Polyporus arcularius HHB13444 TaxID=1314778 RepID=A0A5C3NWR9_9APHY|nr:hypothetical protein K466DRAFT_655989 [Polyporus arcularius HHB13444]